MKIVIVGCGKVGLTIIESLSNEGHDLTIIDINKASLSAVSVKFDVSVILGNGTNADILKSAGVASADLFIACTQRDEINVLSCLAAKKLGVFQTVARIRDPEYCDLFDAADIGINMIINPEHEVAKQLFRALRFPSALKVEPFVEDKVDIFELRIDKESPLINCSLSDLKTNYGISILVCAINRNGKAIIPTGKFEITEGDTIYVTATLKDAESMFKKLKMWKKQLKHIMIIGGGKITYYLCDLFKKTGNELKVIENSKTRCVELAEEFRKVTVINASPSDYEMLRDEGLADADAVLSLLDDNEDNAILSMYAQSLGVGSVTTIVEHNILSEMLAKQGINLASSRSAAADEIVRYVRSQTNTMGGAMRALYRIMGGLTEVMEFLVEPEFKLLGIPFKNASFIPNTLIAAISRGEDVIIPNGDDCLVEGDRVLIVSTGTQIGELNDIVA